MAGIFSKEFLQHLCGDVWKLEVSQDASWCRFDCRDGRALYVSFEKKTSQPQLKLSNGERHCKLYFAKGLWDASPRDAMSFAIVTASLWTDEQELEVSRFSCDPQLISVVQDAAVRMESRTQEVGSNASHSNVQHAGSWLTFDMNACQPLLEECTNCCKSFISCCKWFTVAVIVILVLSIVLIFLVRFLL
eukprot:TRINITY_DN191_c0_g1_i3.p1 TRINITY_DN191_c0_g1~~TRINITY_DN191_c0_g1_i3.p1  ORF type:complete len:190 (-),score=2.99 TRINITY_DN191_c0_g1_i3:253-822(-)